MEIQAFPADAVVMATGGNGLIFGKSTMSVICTGGAASRCYQAGAWFGNPEFIQVHPTAIPGEDKCRLMSESARGEGGRVWVPREKGRRPVTPSRSPRTSAGTSSKRSTPSTATSCPATSPPVRSSGSVRRATASAAAAWSTSTSPTCPQETKNKLKSISRSTKSSPATTRPKSR